MDRRQFVNYFKGERIAVHLGSQVPVPAQRQGGMFCLIWHPLQCSCLEDPRDGGAWWPAVHGVAKSRTQLSDFTFMHWRRAWHPTPVLLPGGSQAWGAWRAAVHGVAKSRTCQATSLWLFAFMHWRRKWQPTPVFLPGESQGRGSLVGCHLWGRTESDMTEAT